MGARNVRTLEVSSRIKNAPGVLSGKGYVPTRIVDLGTP
jgi:hypothetical protein